MMKHSELDLTRRYIEENIEMKDPTLDEIISILTSLKQIQRK